MSQLTAPEGKQPNSPSICVICSGPTRIADELGRYRHEGATFGLEWCEGCKTYFTSPLPGPDMLERYYKGQFPYDWYRDHLSWKRKDARLRFAALRADLGNSCLDFGGGIGYFSEICRANGIRSETWDYAPGAAAPRKDAKWDSAVLFHCLEHARDPREMLKQVSSVLRPGGTLIIAVPNNQSNSYRKRKMRAVWAQPPITHIFHFSKQSLVKLLDPNFEIEDVQYHDRWDANYLADARWDSVTAFVDSLWGKTNSRSLKKASAYVAGLYRNFALLVASDLPAAQGSEENREELLVICRLRS